MGRLRIVRNIAALNIYERLFYLFVLLLALFPGRFTLKIHMLGSSLDLQTFVMWLSLLVFFPVAVIAREKYSSRETAVMLLGFILIWAFASLEKTPIKSDVPFGDRLLPLISMGAAALLGFFYSKITSERSIYDPDAWENALTRFSFVLTGIVALYAAESLVGLGMRSEAASVVNEELGLMRLNGPLGGAAIMPLAIILAIGVHLGNVVKGKKPVALYRISLVFMLMALLLTGSRSAVLAAGIFGLLILFRMRSIKRLLQLGLAALLAVAVVSPFISFQRISNFKDDTRYETMLAGFNAVVDSPQALWFGRGSSTVWTWYMDERLSEGARIWPSSSIYGYMLYHPHSTLLELLVELGIVCLVAFLCIVFLLIRKLYADDAPDSIHSYVTAAVVAAVGMFVFDLFLFKNFQLSMIWWAFAFVVLAVQPRRKQI